VKSHLAVSQIIRGLVQYALIDGYLKQPSLTIGRIVVLVMFTTFSLLSEYLTIHHTTFFIEVLQIFHNCQLTVWCRVGVVERRVRCVLPRCAEANISERLINIDNNVTY